MGPFLYIMEIEKIIKYLFVVLACFYSCSDNDKDDNLNDSYEDCFGTADGLAFIDDCEVCSSGLTGHVENVDIDCTGLCFGEAYINGCNETSDEINDCVTGDIDTCTVDCNGNQIPEDCSVQTTSGCAIYDNCGICSEGTTNHPFNLDVDCFSVCFGDADYDVCGNCGYYAVNECEESCEDCFGIPNGGAEYDEHRCWACELW